MNPDCIVPRQKRFHLGRPPMRPCAIRVYCVELSIEKPPCVFLVHMPKQVAYFRPILGNLSIVGLTSIISVVIDLMCAKIIAVFVCPAGSGLEYE